jgi:phosphoglycerate dehydrogenase-like enzyme
MAGRVRHASGKRALRVLVHAELPEVMVGNIQRAAGPRATVHVLPARDEALQRLAQVEVAFGHVPPDAIAAAAPVLRWVHLPSAGVDSYLTAAVQESGITLTRSRGVYGVAGAEHVLGQMLMFTRRLKAMYDSQQGMRWDHEVFQSIGRLKGQTLGIVGLGDIGSQVAIRARAFGMRILAVKRHPAAQPAYVDNLWGLDGLDTLLAASDHVVLDLPLTPETRCLIDERALGQMRSTAYLYNIGRGAVLDEAALIRCLQAGQIAGAALDVFTEEPLPPDSPLWRLPTVLLTPHVGANGPRDWTDAASLFVDNLGRYRAGRDLINRVDFQHGY